MTTLFAKVTRHSERAPFGARVSGFVTLLGSVFLFGGCDPHPHGNGPVGGAPMCGGIAGIDCPGAGLCVDDRHDDCDPDEGGADCSGVCRCDAIGLCIEGMVWNDSPEVCACEPAGYDPCIATTCPVGTTCVNENGHGVCIESDAGAYDPCIATLCPVGTICVNENGQGVCLGSDGGAVGERCGKEQCAPGQVCCNASCGICTEPGGVCIQIACEE